MYQHLLYLRVMGQHSLMYLCEKTHNYRELTIYMY